MEADFSISLNKVQNIKTVDIKGVGVVKVRRLGSGEDLDLSRKKRRLGKIIDELQKLSTLRHDGSTAKGLKKLKNTNERVDQLSDEIVAIREFEYSLYRGCLSDDEGGKVVDVIMNTLNDEARAEFINQVFGLKKPVEAPEALTPEDEENANE